jgi:hypothetical protein
MTDKKQTQKVNNTPSAEQTTVESNPYKINKSVKDIMQKVNEARQIARAHGKWKSLCIYDINGYTLEITVAPDGRAFLRLVSPNLRNSFVLANAEALRAVVEAGKVIDTNWALFNDLIANLGLRKAGRREVEYI